MGIEVRRLLPQLQVLAFERRPECADILERNMQKLSAPGIQSYVGDFFDQDPGALPAPDALFIGGHGGRLPELLDRVDGVLSHGFVAMNAVPDSSRGQWGAGTRPLRWGL